MTGMNWINGSTACDMKKTLLIPGRLGWRGSVNENMQRNRLTLKPTRRTEFYTFITGEQMYNCARSTNFVHPNFLGPTRRKSKRGIRYNVGKLKILSVLQFDPINHLLFFLGFDLELRRIMVEF